MACLHAQHDDGLELPFVIEKCILASQKQQMIRNLVMHAALYSMRRKQLLAEYLDVQIQTVTHSTHSTTALPNLHYVHSRLQVFVANRFVETLDQPTSDEWRHVKITTKPADIGTRGVTVSLLLET